MSQPTQINTSLCLAMIVRDEASIIQRSLLSIKPFISTWLIHDMGSRDDTCHVIQSTLGDIEGRLEHRTLNSFSEARNALLTAASSMAETIIMLDADEEFQSLNHQLLLPEGSDAGRIDIVQTDYTTRVPRVFRSNALPFFQFDIDEQAVFERQNITNLSDVAIRHYQDGICHRQSRPTFEPRHNEDDAVPIEIAALHRGQQALKSKQLHAALTHFGVVLTTPNTSNEFWLAAYLTANTHLALGDVSNAIEGFRQCFESNPERAEPLMRIAEIQNEHGEHQAAHELCKIIVEMSIAPNADYFEPKIYTQIASALLDETAATTQADQRQNMQTDNNAVDNREQKPLALTIGMATYDDFDGVYFSIVSLVLYHQQFLDQFEILVIDNNPHSEHGKAVKGLCDRVSQARYVAAGEYKGTAVRERIFAEARGELVLCMDCHVFLHQGVVERLLSYAIDNPNSKDLMHGPLYYDNHDTFSTHMEPKWNQGFYGTWGTDTRGADFDAEPFEIPLQGMGLFACFKRHWLGFNHRFRGFGGEEGYIHEKFRQNGGRVLCLPFLRWTHRFDRPNGTNYVNAWADRIRNYLIGWHELGLDLKPVLEHFAQLQGFDLTASVNSRFLRELNSPLWKYDTIYLLSNSAQQRHEIKTDLSILSIDSIVQEINDVSELPSLLRTANARKLANVIIIDAREGAIANLHLQLQDLVTSSSAKVVIQVKNSTPKAYLIDHSSFSDAADCFEQNRQLSSKLLAQQNDSISTVEIVMT